ncbi:DUF4974 domain-containing protein [Marinilabiliaceae bacterium ANBcel2]|nr:DUF4974 domain-containing protein [Marinilabiliaceae bacterium ANBcel2]
MSKESFNILFKKFKSGNLNYSELIRFYNLIDDEQNFDSVRGVLLDDIESIDDDYNSDDILYNKIRDKINQQNKRTSLLKLNNLQRFAAVFIVATLLSVVSFVTFFNREEPIQFVNVTADEVEDYYLFPDGSKLYLNCGASVAYNIEEEGGDRIVKLDGEAWFQVENSNRPFYVYTQHSKIEVLGTSFNVMVADRGRYFEATVNEGVVSVSNDVDRNITLTSGKQYVADEMSGERIVKEVNPLIFSSWKSEDVTFRNLPFGDLVTVLERRYNVDVEVVDSSILETSYSGRFSKETIEEVLNVISMVLPVEYTQTNQNIVIKSLNN